MQTGRQANRRLHRFNRAKRALDVAVVLTLAAPAAIVGGLAYLAILVSSGMPVTYTQRRLGYMEREFRILKFRTMTNATDSAGCLLPDADRVTRLGALMRRTSLDELPQLLNVLRGEMALVGPRPLYVEYRDYYTEVERTRHWVRPGITGLAQTSGRNVLLWDERLRLDVQYVERSALIDDASILIRTAAKVVGASGVSLIAGETGERLDTVRSYPRINGYSLRRLEYVDLPNRVAWFSDSCVRRHMNLPDITLEGSRDWLRVAHKDPDRHDLVVFEVATGRVVAMVGIRARPNLPFPELYILVDPCEQGKGVGKTSMLLLHHWVEMGGVHTGLYLSVAEDNNAAIALYERNGYRTIGHLAGGRRREMVWQTARAIGKAEEAL